MLLLLNLLAVMGGAAFAAPASAGSVLVTGVEQTKNLEPFLQRFECVYYRTALDSERLPAIAPGEERKSLGRLILGLGPQASSLGDCGPQHSKPPVVVNLQHVWLLSAVYSATSEPDLVGAAENFLSNFQRSPERARADLLAELAVARASGSDVSTLPRCAPEDLGGCISYHRWYINANLTDQDSALNAFAAAVAPQLPAATRNHAVRTALLDAIFIGPTVVNIVDPACSSGWTLSRQADGTPAVRWRLRCAGDGTTVYVDAVDRVVTPTVPAACERYLAGFEFSPSDGGIRISKSAAVVYRRSDFGPVTVLPKYSKTATAGCRVADGGETESFRYLTVEQVGQGLPVRTDPDFDGVSVEAKIAGLRNLVYIRNTHRYSGRESCSTAKIEARYPYPFRLSVAESPVEGVTCSLDDEGRSATCCMGGFQNTPVLDEMLGYVTLWVPFKVIPEQ